MQRTISIAIEAQGNEVTAQGTLHFDPSKLSISPVAGTNANPDVQLGPNAPHGTKIITNISQLANGDLGLVFDFNGNGAAPAVCLKPGLAIIAYVRFTLLSAEATVIPISWNDNVFRTKAGDADAQPAAVMPVAGSITTGKRAFRISNERNV